MDLSVRYVGKLQLQRSDFWRQFTDKIALAQY